MTSDLPEYGSPAYWSQSHAREQSAYDGFVEFVTRYCERDEKEGYAALLHFLTEALSPNEESITNDMIAQLPYYLNDSQRENLRRIAEAAGRVNDAEINAEITEKQFHAQRVRVYGSINPHIFDMPFWTFMVQHGWSAYKARVQFDAAFRAYKNDSSTRRKRAEAGEVVGDAPPEVAHPGWLPPIWCFDRFGMSRTLLHDGRVLYIAGEHEDFYDSDFCIYNDVIVFDTDLRITIYGYPEEVFPPTDFHTASLVGKDIIYIIGSLGYQGSRQFGTTPVYRLDINTMRIEAVATHGVAPGWISEHKAEYVVARHAIKISGGKMSRRSSKRKETYTANSRSFWLDLTTMRWSVGSQPPALVDVSQKEGVE